MILDKIVQVKHEEIIRDKSNRSLESLIEGIKQLPPTRDFATALKKGAGVNVIAEVKKASPSKGLICPDFDPVRLAQSYSAGGAAAISVLTDEQFFQGSLEYLQMIRSQISLPLLRKDFVLDIYQIYQARLAGADAVLLITRILKSAQLTEMIALTKELGLAALVEVHDKEDVSKALAAGAEIIGINNRDLATFTTDLNVTLELVRCIPEGRIIVSESGINRPEDLVLLGNAGVNAVLVGEALARERDVTGATVRLVTGGKGFKND